MGKRGYSYLIIFLVLFSFILPFFFFSLSVNAITSNHDLDFFGDTLYNNTFNENVSYYNLRHSDVITGTFNGTYSFTDDIIGGDPIGWILDEGGGTVNVISSEDKHSEIVELHDTSGSFDVGMTQTISGQESGTIEFWVCMDDTSDQFRLITWDGGTPALHFGINNDFIYYYYGSSNNIIASLDNYWYHISIDFECGAGSYRGLSADTFNVYIDGVEYGAYNFQTAVAEIDTINFRTLEADTGYYCYVDALGYSWSANYTEEENIYPELETIDVDILKNDRYEFELDGSSNPYQDKDAGSTDFYGWSEKNDVSLHVYYDNDQFPNREYKCGGVFMEFGGIDDNGIYNDTLNVQGEKVNITFDLQFDDLEVGAMFKVYIDSLDTTNIVDLKFEVLSASTIGFYYYTGVVYSLLHTLSGCDSTSNFYSFNLYLYDFEVICRYYLNDVLTEVDTFDFIDDKKGIDALEFYVIDSTTKDIAVRLNYVGIYQYNCSLALEHGYISYFSGNYWDFDSYNLVTIEELNYNLQINSHSSKTFYYSADTTQIQDYSTDSFFYNYHGSAETQSNSSVNFITKGFIEYSNISFSIYRVAVNYSSVVYVPTVTYTEVDKQESYYYMDGSVLYCNMTYDSNAFEGVLLTLDIPNINTQNSSLCFTTRYQGYKVPYVINQYEVAPEGYYAFSPTGRYQKFVLPQTYSLDKILINFTDFIPYEDNYTNQDSGYTFGYLYNLTLEYLPHIDFSLSIVTLMTGFIPLIVILTPTIALHEAFPKKKSEIVLPAMILMTIITFVSELIPLWLFAVNFICFGFLFLFRKKEGGG